MNDIQKTYKFDDKISEDALTVKVESLESPVLLRLIEEIKNHTDSTTHNYDRVHNRHNR